MIVVRSAEEGDVAAIAVVLDEMDSFYGASEVHPVEDRTPYVRDALFRTPAAAYALLAWEGDNLVGLAAYSFLWPAAGVTRSLYLKELYVRQEQRRQGVGRLLMRTLCQIAVEMRCSRVEWTTDSDNPGAQRFYELIGVGPDPSKIFHRVEGEAMVRMAEGRVPADAGGGGET